MKRLISLVLVLISMTCQAQITLNIRYTAPDGNALKYMEEMTTSGLADSIRAIPGCLRYDYFIPQDDPTSVLLIDSWEDQNALNSYYSSHVMKDAEALRAKYKLERNAQMFSPVRPPMNHQQSIKPDSTMIVRISEIEVYPEFLKEYLEFAHNVGVASVREEPGVICIYPMQQLRNDCQIRILEIYASQEAYQQHIKTDHFLTYKQGTLHMVKSLDLVDMRQIAPENLPLVFKKAQQ
ncbi:MAG: antibiotic biosynthesis monooxygenase [Bacteroidales bacterium]|nr:antibiotic biosynthesis monooxygenase [Bacteroidales bacterium]